MRLLNDLLNMHDGYDDEAWQKECKKRMIDMFPREDPFSILVPDGFDLDKVCCNYVDSRLMIKLFSDLYLCILLYSFEFLPLGFSIEIL